MKENGPIAKDSSAIVTTGNNGGSFSGDNNLIESIWKTLDGRVDREQIRQAILEVEPTYEDATVRTYIPILLRREVLEMLQ